MSNTSTSNASRAEGISGRRAVLVFGAATVAVVAYFLLGMPGMDHDMGGMAMSASDMAVGADQFETRLAEPGSFVVNVHVPDAGFIRGTEAWIPYDRILDDPALPSDRATPILLYCETGRMSADAAAALMEKGYREVVYLRGGMRAWKASGRSLA